MPTRTWYPGLGARPEREATCLHASKQIGEIRRNRTDRTIKLRISRWALLKDRLTEKETHKSQASGLPGAGCLGIRHALA